MLKDEHDDTPTATRGHRLRVCIDGQWHSLVDNATLEGLCRDHLDEIHMPAESSGWATLHIGPVRWASWITGERVK
jgi:hypothetical protein